MLGGTLETALKLTVSQSNLQKGLGIVSRAVSPRSTLPVLANVLLKAEAGRLMLAATNLELGIVTWIDATVQDEGAVTVPARLLGDLVGTLPNEAVSLTVNENTCTLTVRCGASSTEIKGIDAGEFPPMPAADPDKAALRLKAGALKSALAQVTFAAATDEARPTLQGVQTLVQPDRLMLSATDGFRVSVRSMTAAPSSSPSPLIIPAHALNELARLLGEAESDVAVVLNDNRAQVTFVIGAVELTTQTIDGNFPDVNVIIPRTFRGNLTTQNGALARAVKRARLLAGDTPVKLTLAPGALKIEGQSEDLGGNDETIDCQMDGPEQLIAFNSRFLLDALEALTGPAVKLEYNDHKSPVKITDPADDGVSIVVMPMFTGK
jgi:DNA polymerase-3 subunit beta